MSAHQTHIRILRHAKSQSRSIYVVIKRIIDARVKYAFEMCGADLCEKCYCTSRNNRYSRAYTLQHV